MASTRPTPTPQHRNPAPLSFAQESQVKEIYHKRVRGHCADLVRDFAACAHGRTFSSTWACRSQRLAMNSCMMVYATQHEQDAARDEWFATRDKRILEREAKDKKRKEQEKFHNEWWGLPQKGSEDDGKSK